MAEGLTLETASLDRYVSQPPKLDEQREAKIRGLIEKLEGNALNVEELPLRLLRFELARYPEIDISFLSMPQTIQYKGQQIQVPRFSAYPRTQQGFNPFTLAIEDGGCFGFTPILRFKNRLSDEPERLYQQLSKSVEFAQYAEPEQTRHWREISYIFENLPKQERKMLGKKYGKMKLPVNLETNFIGILPDFVKERLKEADKIFNQQTYLVAENSPEQWHETRLVKDPLLIGFFEGNRKYYLIAHFDTTSIESQIAQEFTITK